MKVDCLDHPKLFDLAELLQVEKLMAVGILESLWLVTAKHARRGDIGHLSNRAFARRIGWTGDPEWLMRCLVDTGWLDEHPEHRLIVHDWADHAPRWVLGNLKSQGLEVVGNGSSSSHARHGSCSSLNVKSTLIPIPKPKPTQRTAQRGAQGGAVRLENLPEKLRTDEFLAAWNRWAVHRKEIHKKLTPSTVKAQLAKLAEMGERVAIASIDRTIEKGWIGLVEAQENSHGRQGPPSPARRHGDASKYDRVDVHAGEAPAAD